MSLFGGDSPLSSLSTSPSPPPQSTASAHESADVQDAQIPVQPATSLDTDEDESEYEEDSYDSDEDDDDPDISRPNPDLSRLNSRTWRSHELAHRQIAASLEALEASDLAAHLYNMHNLKYRVRRPTEQLAEVKDWHFKGSWLKNGEQLLFKNPHGEIEAELVPSKFWSAWPLPPGQIRKKDAGVGEPDKDGDSWYIGAASVDDAGETMRQEVLALFLRKAKEQWLSREENEEDEDEKAGNATADPTKSDTENDKPPKLQSAPASDVEMQDDEDNGASRGVANERRGRWRANQQDVPSAKPVFVSDDDSAWQVLGPNVDSLLSRLNHLALSVRRSRLNHSGRDGYSDTSGSEFTSDGWSSATGSRPATRSRVRHKRLPTAKRTPKSRVGSQSASEKSAVSHSPKPLGDDDSAPDYHNDHLDEKGNTSSSSAQSLPRKSKTPLNQSRRSSNASLTPGFKRQTGLMDWSEVLGIAATIGWNETAVARTAQRCAVLFNEQMTFRKFDESATSKPPPDPVQYTPSTIPDYEALGLGASESRKRPFFNTRTLRCPHEDCWGSKKDFQKSYRVIEHVMRFHEYDPRANTEDNEERTCGGVHIDGFLQPITAKTGWLGRGRGRSKSTDGKADTSGRATGKKQKVDDEARARDSDASL